MNQYDPTNRGALFKNDRKEKESHPDYKGSINVDGVDYWLSAWLKEGQKGKFFSMSIQPKEQAPAPKQDKAGQWKAGEQRSAPKRMTYGGASDKSEGYADDGMESDIPF